MYKNKACAMINFICLTGCPDIWSNIITDVSVKGFGVRLIFELVDGITQIVLHNMNGPHPIS